jgi:hypothetical protein
MEASAVADTGGIDIGAETIGSAETTGAAETAGTFRGECGEQYVEAMAISEAVGAAAAAENAAGTV